MTGKWPKYDTTEEEEARIQQGIDADADNPELTHEELANLRPLGEILPQLAAGIRLGRGRPPSPQRKKQVTLRLDADVVEALQKDGRGWQTRINALLRQQLGLKAS